MNNLIRTIEVFKDAIIKNHEVLERGDHKTGNRLMKKIIKLHHEIIASDEGKRLLINLMDIQEKSVQGIAAFYSLPYSPQKATRVLKELSLEGGFIGFEAKRVLENWKKGFYKNIEEL